MCRKLFYTFLPVYLCLLLASGQCSLQASVVAVKPFLNRYLPPKSNVKNGLKISANKRYLVDAVTGEPVFLLATTAWNINALTYADIDALVQSTAKNGFNCIMFALDFYPQADQPNIYGQKAFTGADKTELNPAYFTYCDYIMKKCTQSGIYPMIYTMWSGKTTGMMNSYNPDQLYTLGKRIALKYKNYKNAIFVAGGESSPPYIDTARVNAMGRGLKDGCGSNNLVSVHPCSPHSSSEFYAAAPWLDFYMIQGKSNISGVTYDFTKLMDKDLARTPVKPTWLVEHRYESGVNENAVIQRRTLYLSVFTGGFGYAYGHNALWQMTPHTAQQWMLKSWKAGVPDWKQALNTPAQQQLQHIKALLYAYPYLQRRPDQSLLLSPKADSITNMVKILRDGEPGKNNATYLMAYVSSPQAVTINTDVIAAKKINAYWFNPRTGLAEVIAKQFENTGTYQVNKDTRELDWVLVVDDAAKKYKFNLIF
jgi:hypothetical protein